MRRKDMFYQVIYFRISDTLYLMPFFLLNGSPCVILENMYFLVINVLGASDLQRFSQVNR